MPLLGLLVLLAQAAAPPAPPSPPEATPSGPVVARDVEQGGEALGTITIALRPDKAPLSVANFLEYLRSGHYDGTIFHRAIPDFMIQGGDFTPEMQPRPERPPIRNEARNGLRNSRGAVAMARTSDADSAASQFFINLRNNHNLDFGIAGAGYAVFGQVIGGMEVVDRIAGSPTTRRGTYEDTPVRPVVIVKAYEVKGSPTPPPVAGVSTSPPR
jgi:cyclophilin family peptidyl-prolyl cis-trans isomerase